MKKRLICFGLLTILCISLTGCKGTDYKDAVELQSNGDYEGALNLYNGIKGYRDADTLAAQCQKMINAMSHYEDAKNSVISKNKELDETLDSAQDLIAQGAIALDDSLYTSLESEISDAKAIKKEIPDMPESATEIEAIAVELDSIDYSSEMESLLSTQTVLEESINQYALVDNPTEAYIVDCLKKVENIVDISAVTEDNDPNGNLNKAGGYTAQVYFSSDLINQGSVSGTTVIDKGTDCGGSIEVYANADDANKRNEYLATFDGTIFASGSHTVIGTVVVRTSNLLKASEQKTMEENIIKTFITLE